MPASRRPRRFRLERRHATAIIGFALTGLVIAAPSMQAGASPSPLSEASSPQQIVRVQTPTHADKARLSTLPLDLTEAGGRGYVEVLLRSAADANVLRRNGFKWTVKVADVAAAAKERAERDQRLQALGASSLPSGSTAYRTVEDYNAELEQLAQKYPDNAKLITLPNKSLEGREIKSLEITNNVDARDGKPVMAMFGLHHAREWPSGELTLEFAYELLSKTGSDARITSLLDKVRLISVPVVNPDGVEKTQNLPTMEYKRKNCRVIDGQTPLPGACALAGVSPLV